MAMAESHSLSLRYSVDGNAHSAFSIERVPVPNLDCEIKLATITAFDGLSQVAVLGQQIYSESSGISCLRDSFHTWRKY